MDDLMRSTFADTMRRMSEELKRVRLSYWNESVFRYFFCRALAERDAGVAQLVECDRIDLVLHRADEKAFVEFKLYLHQRRFDPYSGTWSGYKGGPGNANLAEFRRCVDHLHARESPPGLFKYVALVYVDPVDGIRPNLRYASHYDDYRHPDETVVLDFLESPEPIDSDEGRIQARLLAVRTARS